MIEKDIGKRIQKMRKKKGMTQEVLAEKLGISTNHLSALERGQYNIKTDMLVAIINELECTSDDVFLKTINQHNRRKQ